MKNSFLIDAGCGVGNAIFPIAKLNLPNLEMHLVN